MNPLVKLLFSVSNHFSSQCFLFFLPKRLYYALQDAIIRVTNNPTMNVTRKGKKLDDEMTKGMGKAKMEAREHASNAKGNRGEEIACPDVTSLRGAEARAGSDK